MVLGTASHVGKSLVAAGFCRLFADEGHRVAPFKAQNMALNSFVTWDGGEIGRAQVAQAEAAGVEPETDMNPILLKPMGGVSQVVLDGSPIGVMSARAYYAIKDRLWEHVVSAYERLASRFDRVVLEGAGSPVEINLKEQDLTNLRMAHLADAAIVLVADIERGGVFAQIVGTWELMEPRDRQRVVGFIINKFRGDATLLDSGLDYLRERTGVPVLGVLPFRGDIQIDQEDSLGIEETASSDETGESGEPLLDVAVARLPGISNFTDVWRLSRVPGVRVRYVERGEDLGSPDLIVVPGTKTTVRDLEWLRRTRLAERILELARDANGPHVIGLCGGFQMLGKTIRDPLSVESSRPLAEGLALLDVSTTFSTEKARHRVSGTTVRGEIPLVGYEIHMGESQRGGGVHPFARLTRERDGAIVADGAVSPDTRIMGTYVHGLFDSLPFTSDLVNRLRARRGFGPLSERSWIDHQAYLARRYDALADFLRGHLALDPIRAALDRRILHR
jgi:adenosylcobyric acid synthase